MRCFYKCYFSWKHTGQTFNILFAFLSSILSINSHLVPLKSSCILESCICAYTLLKIVEKTRFKADKDAHVFAKFWVSNSNVIKSQRATTINIWSQRVQLGRKIYFLHWSRHPFFSQNQPIMNLSTSTSNCPYKYQHRKILSSIWV